MNPSGFFQKEKRKKVRPGPGSLYYTEQGRIQGGAKGAKGAKELNSRPEF